jgi:hypothetical protein
MFLNEKHWLSFAQFQDRARRFASFLSDCGVENGDRVIVVSESGFDAMTAVCAVGLIGGLALLAANGPTPVESEQDGRCFLLSDDREANLAHEGETIAWPDAGTIDTFGAFAGQQPNSTGPVIHALCEGSPELVVSLNLQELEQRIDGLLPNVNSRCRVVTAGLTPLARCLYAVASVLSAGSLHEGMGRSGQVNFLARHKVTHLVLAEGAATTLIRRLEKRSIRLPTIRSVILVSSKPRSTRLANDLENLFSGLVLGEFHHPELGPVFRGEICQKYHGATYFGSALNEVHVGLKRTNTMAQTHDALFTIDAPGRLFAIRNLHAPDDISADVLAECFGGAEDEGALRIIGAPSDIQLTRGVPFNPEWLASELQGLEGVRAAAVFRRPQNDRWIACVVSSAWCERDLRDTMGSRWGRHLPLDYVLIPHLPGDVSPRRLEKMLHGMS